MPESAIRRVGTWQFGGPAIRRRLVRALARRLSTRPGVIARGEGGGLRFDPAGGNPGYVLGTTEPHVQAALARVLRPGDVVYDVGANVGFMTVIAARLVGPSGAVYAFEPAPALAERLRANVAANGFDNVTVLEQAAWSAAGRGRLHVATATETPGSSSLVGAAQDDLDAIEVELVGVDELVQRGTLRPPRLIKIDVEGAELVALHGMRLTLAWYRPVLVCELHWNAPDFLAFAAECLEGYEIETLGSDEPLTRLRNVHVAALPGAGSPTAGPARGAS